MSDNYKKCKLCARNCAIDRTVRAGYCGMTDKIFVARAALHMWEEPPISGVRGSGTIFFSGCSLKCEFCQNADISRGRSGKEVTAERLSEIMLELQNKGAHNINFVTPTHYIPSVARAITLARDGGLSIPVVYNTASYENVDALRDLRGLVDIYLPDFKYFTEKTALALSSAPGYADVAKAAIDEMVEQTGAPVLDGDGMLVRGTVVRVLLLPSHVAEAKLIVKYLHDTYGDGIYISLMNQYTPMPGMTPPLDRRVTREEYRQLVDYADRIGVRLGFIQEEGTATESFIPPFNNEGV